jgi:hypothetical protein
MMHALFWCSKAQGKFFTHRPEYFLPTTVSSTAESLSEGMYVPQIQGGSGLIGIQLKCHFFDFFHEFPLQHSHLPKRFVKKLQK